jgi:hypothetical protein
MLKSDSRDCWESRYTSHDEIAVPLVVSAFAAHGFEGFAQGTETDGDRLHDLLRKADDDTGMLLRYRPDRVLICPRRGAMLCEIKGEGGLFPNFAIEVPAWWSARRHEQAGLRVAVAFAVIPNGPISCCWASKIPFPSTICVPRREGYPERRAWVRAHFPGIPIDEIPYRSGSGTPFFLVPKRVPFLLPLAEFIARLGS